ncbi:MAG TPA: hypothetical protein VH325_11060 [Bryobacteraceae bacterium]|jgi:hypothetical protein|nr:hypothetical protein [Bryobacteraceae bacterium]
MDTFDFVDDPITAAQVETLASLLGEEWTEEARDGFLVISGRFVDYTGTDRTEELEMIFRTHLPSGRRALRRSLEKLFSFVGSLHQFEADYPVLINDPEFGSMAVFPQLPIIGIEEITSELYRVLDSHASVHGTRESVRDYIMREGKLPYLNPGAGLILRKKPRIHWCSYERYASPLATSSALQILPSWNSDCKLRATLLTGRLEGLVFVAFNGDTEYPDKTPGAFAGYHLELKAQDHEELPGGGLQVGVVGGPEVFTLEEWIDSECRWSKIWSRAAKPSP